MWLGRVLAAPGLGFHTTLPHPAEPDPCGRLDGSAAPFAAGSSSSPFPAYGLMEVICEAPESPSWVTAPRLPLPGTRAPRSHNHSCWHRSGGGCLSQTSEPPRSGAAGAANCLVIGFESAAGGTWPRVTSRVCVGGICTPRRWGAFCSQLSSQPHPPPPPQHLLRLWAASPWQPLSAGTQRRGHQLAAPGQARAAPSAGTRFQRGAASPVSPDPGPGCRCSQRVMASIGFLRTTSGGLKEGHPLSGRGQRGQSLGEAPEEPPWMAVTVFPEMWLSVGTP